MFFLQGAKGPAKKRYDAAGAELVDLFVAMAWRHHTPLYQQMALLAPCPASAYRARELTGMVGRQLRADAAVAAHLEPWCAAVLGRSVPPTAPPPFYNAKNGA